MRDSLLLASDAGSRSYEPFVAKLALHALLEKTENRALISFLAKGDNFKNWNQHEGVRIRAFFAGLDLIGNSKDLNYVRYLQKQLGTQRTGELLAIPLANLALNPKYISRVGEIWKEFAISLLNSEGLDLIIYNTTLRGDVNNLYQSDVAVILMQLSSGIVPNSTPWEAMRARVVFSKLVADKTFDFEMAENVLLRFLSSKRQDLHEGDAPTLLMLLSSPALSNKELRILVDLIKQEPGGDRVISQLNKL